MFSLSFLYFPFSLPVLPSTGPTPGWTILSLTPSTTPDYTAKLCGRFVSHLFACPDVPLPWHLPLPVQPQLDHFIVYALHHTRLHSEALWSLRLSSLCLPRRPPPPAPPSTGPTPVGPFYHLRPPPHGTVTSPLSFTSTFSPSPSTLPQHSEGPLTSLPFQHLPLSPPPSPPMVPHPLPVAATNTNTDAHTDTNLDLGPRPTGTLELPTLMSQSLASPVVRYSSLTESERMTLSSGPFPSIRDLDPMIESRCGQLCSLVVPPEGRVGQCKALHDTYSLPTAHLRWTSSRRNARPLAVYFQ